LGDDEVWEHVGPKMELHQWVGGRGSSGLRDPNLWIRDTRGKEETEPENRNAAQK